MNEIITAIAADRNNNEVIFKNCFPLNGIITDIYNTKADNAKDIDVVMLIYDLIII